MTCSALALSVYKQLKLYVKYPVSKMKNYSQSFLNCFCFSEPLSTDKIILFIVDITQYYLNLSVCEFGIRLIKWRGVYFRGIK